MCQSHTNGYACVYFHPYGESYHVISSALVYNVILYVVTYYYTSAALIYCHHVSCNLLVYTAAAHDYLILYSVTYYYIHLQRKLLKNAFIPILDPIMKPL